MKQLILLRHSVRIDKGNTGPVDTSSWLLNYDPPLNSQEAKRQVDNLHVTIPLSQGDDDELIIHSSPYNRCIQTLELLVSELYHEKHTKLRIDQALSEWLNYNFNSNFLPPNDNGMSLLNNINQYLYQQKSNLIRDMNWDSYKFGRPGDYGEEYDLFKERCLQFLNKLLKFYENSNKTVVVVSHGAVISVLIQLILHKPFFKEVPLCDPVIMTKLNQNLFQFHSQIDFLKKFNDKIYKLKDLTIPQEYETNMFVDNNGESDYSSEDEENEEEGIVFKVRSRSNTTGSINPKLKKNTILPSSSEINFNNLKKSFFNPVSEEVQQHGDGLELHHAEEESSDDGLSLNFAATTIITVKTPSPTATTTTTTTSAAAAETTNEHYSNDKNHLKSLLLNSNNNLYSINEEDDYWFGFNR